MVLMIRPVFLFLFFVGDAAAKFELWEFSSTINSSLETRKNLEIKQTDVYAVVTLRTTCQMTGSYMDLKVYDTQSWSTVVRASVPCTGEETVKYSHPTIFNSSYSILATAPENTDYNISVLWETSEVELTRDAETNEYSGRSTFNVSGESYVIRSINLEKDMIVTDQLAFVQISVSSEDQYIGTEEDGVRYEAKLLVTRNSDRLEDFFTNPEFDGEGAIRISFSTFGMITISNASNPILDTGEYIIGVTLRPISRHETNDIKRITLRVDVETTYSYVGKIIGLFFFSLLGIAIPLFARLIFDPVNAKESQERPFKMKYWYLTLRNWFWSGKKGITYFTFLLACLLIVSAFQVVHAKYEDMANSGNRDICYYNEKCYRPYGTYYDVSVNGIASNMPFMVHGIILIVFYSILESLCRARGHKHFDYSIPYSFGLAFISEGFGSLLYHICPSQIIFQFDTLFMFVITIIMIVGIFEGYSVRENDVKVSRIAKHKAIRIPKLFAFFIGPVYFFNFMGNFTASGTSSLPGPIMGVFWVIFGVWICGILIWSAYKLDLLPDTLNPNISFADVQSFTEHDGAGDTTQSDLENRVKVGLKRYAKPCKILSFLLYCVIVGLGFIMTVLGIAPFSIYVLGILIIAVVILTLVFFIPLIWTLVRFFYFEGIQMVFNCAISRHFLVIIGIIIYVLIGCGVTAVSLVFFIVFSVTDKSLPASQSREINQGCYLNDFYDTHDFWHLFASFGLMMMTMINVQISKPCRDCYLSYLKTRNKHLDSMAVTKKAADLMRWKLRAQANGKSSNNTSPDGADDVTSDKTVVSMTLENVTNSNISISHVHTDNKGPGFGTPVSD